jgi:hypothetical protein
VNTRAKRGNDLKSSIARKSFTGATFETICKILQTSEKPGFSVSSRVPSTGLSHPSYLLCHRDAGYYVRTVVSGKEKWTKLKTEPAKNAM